MIRINKTTWIKPTEVKKMTVVSGKVLFDGEPVEHEYLIDALGSIIVKNVGEILSEIDKKHES